MKKYFSVFLLLLISLISSAQSNFGIKKIYAFYIEHLPGNIAVDENGKPLRASADTIYTIYIEASTHILWDSAWANNKLYSIISKLISVTPFDAGKKMINNEKIILKTSRGYKLWQLEFYESGKSFYPQKLKQGEILLRGIYNGKIIRKRIPVERQIQLYTPPSV